MKKILTNIALLAVTALAISSCEKKVNDWDVDPSQQRLFKSLVFEASKIGGTDIEIRYSQTVSADKYIFEFSKDNLEFNEIVKTVEILADTLTEFAPSTTPTKVEYRTLFDELDGLTGYSVRMKGINTTTGEESNYSTFFFQTAAEQLFSGADVYVDRIEMYWLPTDRVTHVTVSQPSDDVELQRIDLSTSDISKGSVAISSLKPGTGYSISIYNNEVLRGTRVIKTLGIADGEIIAVRPGDDIPALVSAAVSDGKTDIILMFSGGQTYDVGSLSLPSGVTNISVTGELDTNGEKPLLNIGSFKLGDPIFGRVIFENVNLTATSGTSFLITQDTNNSAVESFSFVNCEIGGFGNGVVRVNNRVAVRQIAFNDCLVKKNGGWGVVNVGKSDATVDSIKFTNSTLIDLSTQLMDVRVAVQKIVIQNCTFYNQNAAMAQLLRFETAVESNPVKTYLPLELQAGNNIIAGTNSGAKLNATSYNYADFALSVSFAGSYRTNEFEIERESRGFADITIFNGSAADLFVNPDAGDFRIKPGNGFGGRGSAGDPRWFE